MNGLDSRYYFWRHGLGDSCIAWLTWIVNYSPKWDGMGCGVHIYGHTKINQSILDSLIDWWMKEFHSWLEWFHYWCPQVRKGWNAFRFESGWESLVFWSGTETRVDDPDYCRIIYLFRGTARVVCFSPVMSSFMVVDIFWLRLASVRSVISPVRSCFYSHNGYKSLPFFIQSPLYVCHTIPCEPSTVAQAWFVWGQWENG